MDFIYALDQLRGGSKVTSPLMHERGEYLFMVGETIMLIKQDTTSEPWIVTQSDLRATDWYAQRKPPTQRVKADGFIDSVVKGL